jgi:hypothetical protein
MDTPFLKVALDNIRVAVMTADEAPGEIEFS